MKNQNFEIVMNQEEGGYDLLVNEKISPVCWICEEKIDTKKEQPYFCPKLMIFFHKGCLCERYAEDKHALMLIGENLKEHTDLPVNIKVRSEIKQKEKAKNI